MSSWSRKDSVGLGIRGYERPGFYSHWGVTFCHFFVSHSKDENANIDISVRMWKTRMLSSPQWFQGQFKQLVLNCLSIISDIKLTDSKLWNVRDESTHFCPISPGVWYMNMPHNFHQMRSRFGSAMSCVCVWPVIYACHPQDIIAVQHKSCSSVVTAIHHAQTRFVQNASRIKN